MPTSAPQRAAALPTHRASAPQNLRFHQPDVSELAPGSATDTTAAVKVQASSAESSIHDPLLQVQLREIQDYLNTWEERHQPDKQQIADALIMVSQGHESKRGLGERNGAYSKAQEKMRHGQGIDDATYARAQKGFGKLGVAQTYANAATGALLGPVGAALPATVSSPFSSSSIWSAIPVGNGACQILADSYEHVLAKAEGMPNFAPEIKAAPSFTKLNKEVTRRNGLLEQSKSIRKNAARALQRTGTDTNKLQMQLSRQCKDLRNAHTKYTSRVGLGSANFVNQATQNVYRTATLPLIVAAGVAGGPFAAWGASVAQRLFQAPFAYMDEILLKSHIMRVNLKYADVLTDAALKAGITRDSPDLKAEHICPTKLKTLWLSPRDVIRTNIQLVYKDELAARLRKLTKLEAALKKEAATKAGSSREQTSAKLVAARKHLEALKTDIAIFEKGDWTELSAGGTIAAMLTSDKEHFLRLAKAKFRRPGEYMAQVQDRLGGFASARAIAGGIGDGIEVSSVGKDALAQSGALGSSVYTSPISVFTKQNETRATLLPPKVKDPDSSSIMRKNIVGPPRPVTAGHLQPIVQIRIPGSDEILNVDLQETRSWYNHTRSAGYIVAESAIDFIKGAGRHLAAPATLPVRALIGAHTDRRIKTEMRKTDALMKNIEGLRRPEPPMHLSDNKKSISAAQSATKQKHHSTLSLLKKTIIRIPRLSESAPEPPNVRKTK